MLVAALKAGMSSNKYTAGSVAQLLGTELQMGKSGKVTKLQALFSKPAEQSPGFKLPIRQKATVSRTF